MQLNSVESLSDTMIFGPAQNRRLIVGTSTPSSPQGNDLWLEPGARYPQPWQFNSTFNRWLSQPFFTTWLVTATATNMGLIYETPIEFYNDAGVTGHQIIRLNGLYTTGAVNDMSNFWRIDIHRLDGTGNYSFLYRLNTDTVTQDGVTSVQNANSKRRINEYPSNLGLAGNTWAFGLNVSKTGSPSNLIINLNVWLRATR